MTRITPKNKMQEIALRSNADFIVLGGVMKSGKTFLSSWIPAYYVKQNLGRGCVYVRKNEANFSVQGGYFDTFRKLYNLRERAKDKKIKENKVAVGTLLTSEDSGVYFDNGYTVKFKIMPDTSQKKIESAWKGIEEDIIIVDEAEDFTWAALMYAQTRIRGEVVEGLNRKMYIIQNPERECFVRQICGCGENGGGWINDDGVVAPEMNGKVKYFVNPNGSLNEIYWGDTKEEVYEKAKHVLQPFLEAHPYMNWYDAILSFVFYDMPILQDEPKYLARLFMSSASASGLDDSWNYSKFDAKDDETNVALTGKQVSDLFRPMTQGVIKKKFMTVDYAGTPNAREGDGKRSDNLTLFLWELGDQGFYVRDIDWLVRPTPQQSRAKIREFRDKHLLSDREIHYDASNSGGELVNDFPTAKGYDGTQSTSHRGKATYYRGRDESVGVSIKLMLGGMVAINPNLANVQYTHSRITKEKNITTIRSHLIFESKSREMYFKNDKWHALSKELAKKSRLKQFSPDLFDNIDIAVSAFIYDAYRLLSDKGMDKVRAHTENFEIETDTPYFAPRAKGKIRNFGDKLNEIIGW